MTTDFENMTADEIRDYTGPIYRAQVWARDPKTNRRESSDLESTTAEGLRAKVTATAHKFRDSIVPGCLPNVRHLPQTKRIERGLASNHTHTSP